jgi:hypothetical protein
MQYALIFYDLQLILAQMGLGAPLAQSPEQGGPADAERREGRGPASRPLAAQMLWASRLGLGHALQGVT